MALYHVYSQTVADGTATSVVRPSDWNSAHSQVVTLAGNTAGASTVSGTNVIFQGGNNVTLSANQAANAATVVFSAANQSVQTQPAGNIVGAGFTSTTTAGVNVVATQNSNGLSMGVPAYLTTYVAQTTQTQNLHNVTLSGNTAGVMAQISSGTMTLAGGNNITLSQNGNAVTISGPNVSQYLTTARASNDAVGLNTALTGNGVAWTVNSSGISLNVPAFLTTAALSNHSHNLATTTTNGSQIVIATTNSAGATMAVPPFLTTAQPVGAYLTTARASNDAVGLNTALTGNGVVWTVNSSGISLNVPAFLTTARASNDGIGLNTAATNVTWTVNSAGLSLNAAGYAGTGTTYAGTNVTATVNMNSNGLALSLSGGGGGTVNQTGPNIAAGTQTATSGTVVFANSNNVTFGMSGSTQVTASVNILGTPESNFMPHANALWAAAQVGQNSIQVQPLCGAPYVTFDRLAYAVQHTQATNSTMTVSCTVHMGVFSLNASTLSLVNSYSGSFSINGSGTASSNQNSGPRWATMTLNAGGTLSGDLWVAFKSSTATSGVNATLSNIVASRINSSWSGFIGVATANSAQSLPGMGFYSATSNGMPSSMAISHITGVSSTAQRPQVFFLTNGALPI